MKLRCLVIGLLFLVAIGSPAWAAYCASCGAKAADEARFCAQCGKPLAGTDAVTAEAGTPASPPTEPSPAATIPAAPSSPQSYQVTSKYLLINGNRISCNNLFWIAEIKGDRARVWALPEPPVYGLAMGWVPIAELVKRSTYTPGATVSCVEPPPPSEIIVIRSRPLFRLGGRHSGHHH